MDPSFVVAESPSPRPRVALAFLIAAVATTAAAAFAMPCRHARSHRTPTFEAYQHIKPVKACVDGRWVYTSDRAPRMSSR